MKQYYEVIDSLDYGHTVEDIRSVTQAGDTIYLRPIPSPGWVRLEDRKPTAEDADEKGYVMIRDKNGAFGYENIQGNALVRAPYTHFHPIAKFVPAVPTFGEWLCALPDYYTSHFESKVKWMNERLAEYQSKWGSK